MTKKNKPLFEDNVWTFERLREVDEIISEIARKELKLDPYPAQIEIISSDQMLDAYSSHGLPLMYTHWSFGKRFIKDQWSYKKGHSGLAYEIVINTNPSIAYLMEDNSMTMQALVIAHASYGHSHFFKNNYLFKQWTDAEAIVDYLQFAKNYISSCEEKYGVKEVERTLDACHALMMNGVDRYKRPVKLNRFKEQQRQQEREEYVQKQVNELWRTVPKDSEESSSENHSESDRFPKDPQENLLYFIEKNSPGLAGWQREIVRIVRKLAQYFLPNMQTKVANEGWASFTHYYIMNRLWEEGYLTDGQMLEVLHSHSSVLTQRDHDQRGYSGFNPYALGFDIFTEIRRICENPTPEDHDTMPHLIGQNWLDTCLDAVENYRDESLISQFLTPNLIRKWKLFEITNNQEDEFVTISGIQNASCYNSIRQTLSQQYNLSRMIPNIQIVNANLKTTRTLELKYQGVEGSELDTDSFKVLKYLEYLWGYDVCFID